ncbi:MAG: TonB-dependent receptor [Flavobacteriia bacterium]|nr:TonB-dependent receptor [Flavobacteriia bacterium]
MKFIKYPIILFAFLSNLQFLFGQTSTQSIKGMVIDKQSQVAIPSVLIKIFNTDTIFEVESDIDGKYLVSGVKPGRYDLYASFIGYKSVTIPNIVVTTGKEVVVDISLEEQINSIQEVVISANKKNETNNELTSVSARSFSTEEVNRFAGGRSDPSRMAANFAGVSSPDDSRNDLVIRGNSPTGVLWRIEGLNIPNPNHFSTIGTTGGPVSALNTNVLKNSDFFTSAFPSEYGNATAGVFDLGFRKGNSDKREHTLQLGALTGLEAVTEGPVRKSKGSSYLIAYRYSFTEFAQKAGIPIGTTATPFYQDLSFKINGGKTKIGKFVLFGVAGKSRINFLHDQIDSTDLFANPTRDSYFTSKMALIGVSHFARLNQQSYFKTVIGATYSASIYNEDSINKNNNQIKRILENTTQQVRYTINSSFNSKMNSKIFLKIGVLEEIIGLNLFYRSKYYTTDWKQIWDYNDYTSLLQVYAHVKYTISNRFTLNAGLHNQYLVLNKSNSLEPRIGLKFQVNEKSNLSFGYGLHSQMQPIDAYFYRTLLANGTYVQSNINMGFTKSNQFVLGYEIFPKKDWRVKVETYYQYLFNVPVTQVSSAYSMLNAGASFFPNETSYLVNKGTGENYGLELTLEKFFSKGYYTLITGSIYESKYKGSDDVLRNTGFNGKFVYNILAGKEFKLGSDKRNALTFDVKYTHAGGRFYTPVDLVASQLINFQVLKGDGYAYTQRNPNFFRLDVKIGFTLNSKKKKMAQSWYLDIQNITNHKNVFAQRYNPLTGNMNTAYQIGFFPNFVYKFQF